MSLLEQKIAAHKRLRKIVLSQRDIMDGKDSPGAFRRRYTLAELESVYDKAKGRCGICGDAGKLHLDHCHNTGKIRGLLCMSCNTGIGKLKDSPDILRKAIAYLER